MSVRHALLALLTTGPSYGLRLREEFEARTGEVWPINGGQVYSTLQRLERDGLVASDDESASGAQRRFRLTGRGRDELDSWLRTPPDLTAPPRDDLVIKVMVAAAVPKLDVRRLLQVHRRRLVEVMREYTRIKEVCPDDVNLALVADAELLRLDGQVRWLDAVEGRLGELRASTGRPSQAPPRVLPRHRRPVSVRR